MHQIKLFSGDEAQIGDLESDINAFLRSGVRVVQVFGNMSPQTVMDKGQGSAVLGQTGPTRRFAPSDVFVGVVYEEA